MPASLDELIKSFRCTFFPVQVLVVDDDVTSRAAMRRVLEHHGYTVIVAEDAPDALRMLERTHVPVDLLVTDVQMPGMNGDVLVARVRDAWPELPVVFVSGEPSNVRLVQETSGQVQFLAKPFLPAELLETVREALGLPLIEDTEIRNSVLELS
jgi:two-component system cell cycle sensor histidine kinase/response regulator CckA